MRITGHSVGAVIVEKRSDSTVFCASMKYINRRGWSFRHMMETGENGETVIETLRNGLLDEIAGDDKQGFEYRLLRSEPILINFRQDEKNPGGVHLQVFFLVEITKGEMRKAAIQDGDAVMDPPKMVEIGNYIDTTAGKTVTSHWKASNAAVVALAVDRAVFDRYQEIVLAFKPEPVTSEQMDAIASYDRKW